MGVSYKAMHKPHAVAVAVAVAATEFHKALLVSIFPSQWLPVCDNAHQIATINNVFSLLPVCSNVLQEACLGI